MKTNLFTEIITDRGSFDRYRNSTEIFMPLIKYIYETNRIKLGEVSATRQSSDAVFFAGDTVIKIFQPPETDFSNPDEYNIESEAMMFCKSLGVLTPDIICTGTVYDDLYTFNYNVMNYIDGVDEGKAVSGYNNSEKIDHALKLKEISGKIHIPADINIPRYDDPCKIDHHLWNIMPESFREDRKIYLSNVKFPEAVFSQGDFGGDNMIIDKYKNIYLIDFAESMSAPYYYDDGYPFGGNPVILEAYFGNYKTEEFYELQLIAWLINWFGAVLIDWRAKDMGIDFAGITNVNALRDMIIKTF